MSVAGLHPPQPPAPSTSRQNGSGPPSTPGEGGVALSPGQATTYPTGATLSYREDGARVGGDGQGWVGPSAGRSLDQGPVCTLPMPEFWCSVAYFELDTQVRHNQSYRYILNITLYHVRLVKYSKYRVAASQWLWMDMLIPVQDTDSVLEL